MDKTFKFEKSGRNDQGKTVFLSEAMFIEIQPGIYQFYKRVMLESKNTLTGKITHEEAGKTIPWGKPLTKAQIGDPIIITNADPETGEMLELTPVEMALRQAAIASKNYEIKR